MSPLMILLQRKGYLQLFGSKIAKIGWCYCHDLGQSERNIFDFSLCATVSNINYDLHICWQIVPPLIALLAAILSKWSCMIEGYIQKLMESAQYLAHVRRKVIIYKPRGEQFLLDRN